MADRQYYHEDGPKALRSWVLSKMMEGAGWAALFVVGISLGLVLLIWLGGFLPEESKQAPDPMPESSLSVPAGPSDFA